MNRTTGVADRASPLRWRAAARPEPAVPTGSSRGLHPSATGSLRGIRSRSVSRVLRKAANCLVMKPDVVAGRSQLARQQKPRFVVQRRRESERDARIACGQPFDQRLSSERFPLVGGEMDAVPPLGECPRSPTRSCGSTRSAPRETGSSCRARGHQQLRDLQIERVVDVDGIFARHHDAACIGPVQRCAPSERPSVALRRRQDRCGRRGAACPDGAAAPGRPSTDRDDRHEAASATTG